MNAFSSSFIEEEGFYLECIMRSSNHKFLDIHFNLPQEIFFLEPYFMHQIKRKIKRGYIQVIFSLKATPYLKPVFNLQTFEYYYRTIKSIFGKKGIKEKIDLYKILSLEGVFTYKRKNLPKRYLSKKAQSLFKQTLQGLLKNRIQEGKFISQEIKILVYRIKEDLKKIKKLHANFINFCKKKLTLEERERFLKSADIREEIKRIQFFLKEINKIINTKNSQPKGKLLDFLLQELLRESTALISKPSSEFTKKEVVHLKAKIESIRQQVQNIE